MATSPTSQNDLAKRLKSLHISGQPLLLANVFDAHSANLVASNSSTTAIATASFAIAATQGVSDDDMSLSQNLQGIRNVVAGLKLAGKTKKIPLTADLQDCYDDPAETVRQVIKLGVVGCNIEDLDNSVKPKPRLREVDEAVERIKLVMKTAKGMGVPDFVVNARVDALGYGKGIDEVIKRGRAYLDAGATTVFVWGCRVKVITEEEIKQMVEAFGGRLAVQPGGHDIETLRKAGVTRISVGPALWREAMSVFDEAAKNLLTA